MSPLRLSACAIAWLACTTAFAGDAPRRPNVVVILTDDQGYGDLSRHGNPVLKTPNLDRLAERSVRLERFLVNPLCAPTRASILTGRYALRTGVFGVAQGKETMRPDETTLGVLFRRAGYRTGYFGKWHNGEHYPQTPRGQGFDQFLGYCLGHWNNYFDPRLKSDERWIRAKGYMPDLLTDAAVDFAKKHRTEPFLVYLAYNTPHSPHQVPDAYFDAYRKKGVDDALASIYGMVANLDDNIGRFLTALANAGLADDTIVVFLTDNGPNGARFNGGMRGQKGSLYLGGVRVPCFVSWPGKLAPRDVPENAAHIDLLPTLCSLCGIEAKTTHPLDGRSLVPLLQGKRDGWPARPLFIQNSPKQMLAFTQGSVLVDQWHLVNPGKGWELYDLASDFGEQKNLAKARPEVVKQWAGEYDRWWTDASRATSHWPVPIPVGHAAEPSVDLPAAQAKLSGGARLSGKHPNNAWAVDFKADAGAAWEIDVVRPGRYALAVTYVNPGEPTTATVRLGESLTKADLGKTPRVQIPSPDRVPRTEVFELEWHTVSGPTAELPVGKRRIEVSFPTGGAAVEIQGVTLTGPR